MIPLTLDPKCLQWVRILARSVSRIYDSEDGSLEIGIQGNS